MAPDLDAMLNACDAALLIGDPALQVDRRRYRTLRPSRRVGRTHRQVIRFRFLGDSKTGPLGTERLSNRRCIQDLARPRAITQESRGNRAGVGSAPWPGG